ncbi:MAG: glycosyltransferase [Anaerolineae bacterium]|nr:glycosyltransferase [Anaerolineae bacterium]
MAEATGPAVLVWSSLFPGPAQPQAGIFIRERMFRVGSELPMTVISPQPWFPLQGLIRRFRPHFRPPQPRQDTQSGIVVLRPRYFSVPGVLKRFDGLFMALGARRTVRRLRQAGRASVIDAHFGYPDGYAATLVAGWEGLPCTITLRGTELRHSREPALRRRLVAGLRSATRVFAVSGSLKRLAVELGLPDSAILVVGNGVDSSRFSPMPRAEARRLFGIPEDARVLVTVGGLVERKGFHRVIACLPELLKEFPRLHYLAVGSAGPEGDFSALLRAQVAQLGLGEHVHFLGALPPDEVGRAVSAADVSVLATRNEGWANVLLEAMACGVPVVATDVGGNAEVVCSDELGTIVPFDDHAALLAALRDALRREWDRSAIRRYAEHNDWNTRVPVLVGEFRRIATANGGRASD